MKKVCILALSLVSVFYLSNAAFCKGGSNQLAFAIKGGIDLMGKTELDSDDIDLDPGDVDNSISIGAELFFPITEQFIIGGGIVYQFSRGIDETGWEDDEFNYIPIYGLVKYYFKTDSAKPFVVGNIGYGLLYGDMPGVENLDLGGGLYYGLGGGVEFENGFFIEGLYTVNKGTVSGTVAGYDIEGDHKYTKLSIFFGYKF